MKVPRAKRKKRSYKYLLEDMREAMESVISYTENITSEDFFSDKLISDAVIRNFEVMGEAAKNVPHKVQNKYPDIPWKKFQMLRNFLAHQYFGVDLNLVWRISKDHIPFHILEMDRIISREKYA